MGLAVTTVASGGLPVKDMAGPGGIAVTEVASYGLAITKVTGALGGLGVSFVNAAGGPAVTYVTFDPATVTAVTLSGGNLVATNTGTTTTNQGASVAAVNGKTSGKYYFEIAFTTLTGTGANISTSVGVKNSSGTYSNFHVGTNSASFNQNGNAIQFGGSSFGTGVGQRASGNVIGIAVDLDNRRIWFRVSPAGNWNGLVIGSANPATNVGGGVVPTGTIMPAASFGGVSGTANNVSTANFGASAFSGAVPAGFTSGWPS